MDLDAGQMSHALVGLQPNTDYVVMVAPLFGQLEGPTATVQQRTGRCWVQVMLSCCCAGEEAGTSPHSPYPAVCWVAGSRVAQGTLAHEVPLAEAGTDQTLQTNILGPTSIQVLWTSARDARGYRLEWKRATGGLGVPVAPVGLPCQQLALTLPFLQDQSPPEWCLSPAAPIPTS